MCDRLGIPSRWPADSAFISVGAAGDSIDISRERGALVGHEDGDELGRLGREKSIWTHLDDSA